MCIRPVMIRDLFWLALVVAIAICWRLHVASYQWRLADANSQIVGYQRLCNEAIEISAAAKTALADKPQFSATNSTTIDRFTEEHLAVQNK